MADLILLFIAVAFVAARLYSVFGKDDNTKNIRVVLRPVNKNDKTVDDDTVQIVKTHKDVDKTAAESETDEEFNKEAFLNGARKVFELILQAFNKGELTSVKELLNKKVYDAFNSVLAERKEQNITSEVDFICFDKSEVKDVKFLKNSIKVVVEFVSEQVNLLRNAQGEVVALVNYMSQILVELVKLANLIITVTKAIACGNRVQSIFEMETSMVDGNGSKKEDTGYTVEFRNVSMRYKGAGADTLTGIDFKAKPGDTIGIIGGTGSGKSSVVNLIPRFYDVTEGQVMVDGMDVRDYKITDLRDKIGIVPQKAVLFAGTVRSNLAWGKEDATEEEMQQALSVAQAAEVVDKKDGKLDAEVEQGGKNFSGGQKQRLTIARALVKQPEILIMDDSSSALDYATDAKLRQAIHNMPNRPTVFIVSQRAASIMYADKIIVLDDGTVAGAGTHEELLKNCSVYQEIYYSQFKRTEGGH